MDVRDRLAKNMKALRKERGWSQEALAGEARLDRTYVSGIERKVKNPTITVVDRVAAALGCKLGELLDKEGELIVAKRSGMDDPLLQTRQLLADQILEVENIPELAKVTKKTKLALAQLDKYIANKGKS